MKNFVAVFILVLLGCNSALAENISRKSLTDLLQSEKVTINISNKHINVILDEIYKQTKISYMLKENKDVSELSNLSLNVKNISLKEALDKLLANTSFTYEINEGVIAIVKKQPVKSVASQKILIKGRVVDKENKSPIVGATIIVVGTPIGAISDNNGYFSFLAGSTDKLEVSYAGKKSIIYSKPISSKESLLIEMENDNIAIDDVVVTGIFTKSKESYTGATTTMTSKDLKKFGNRSVLSQIRNIDPSFNVMENNAFGSDPNKLPDIQMRGSTSLGVDIKDLQSDSKNSTQSNLPLFILDGFEISLQKMIDMDESIVESITLLKDASATAMYGARGANGIVVLTSRKVEAGKVRVSYKGTLSIEGPDLTTYDLLNAREKIQFEVDAGLYNATYEREWQDLMEVYGPRKTAVERNIDTYWLKYPIQVGVGNRHSIRIDGGDQNFKYAATVGYNNIRGAMKGSVRNTLSGNMFLQYNYGKFSFQNDLSVTANTSDNSEYGSFSKYTTINPYFRPYDDSGVLIKMLEDTYSNNGPTLKTENPLYNASLPYKDQSKYTNIQNNFAVEWNVLPSLSLRGRFTVISNNGRSDLYKSAKHTDFETDEFSGEGYARRGSYDYGTNYEMNYEGDFTVNYNKTIADKHQIYAGLNYNFAEDNYESYSVQAEGYSAPNLDYFGAGNAYKKAGSPGSYETGSRRLGFLANFNYTYDKKYFIDLSGKMEGSSKFGSNNRMAPFWSGGLGWNIHNEKFIKNKDLFGSLRLRASYGITGSQNFNPYQAMTTFKYYNGTSYRNWLGSYMVAYGNPELKWQQTKQTNIGIDMVLVKGLVRVNADYYNKMTDDVLSDVNIPLSSGFNSYKANIGKVRNRGVEVTANIYLIRNTKSEITWSIGGSLAHNQNKIMEISNSLQFLNESLNKDAGDGPSFLLKEGESKNTLYTVRSLGIDPANGRELFLKKDGSMTYTWDYNDKVACGINEPKVWGNFNTMFRYKGFSFNAVFGYRLSGYVYNQTLIDRVENVNPWNNVDRRAWTDRWKKPGDISFYRDINETRYSSKKTKASSRFVQKENTIECRSINVSYDVNTAWSQRVLCMEYISIGIYCEDAFRISTIKQERGTSYPFTRKFSASLNVRF